MKDSAEDLEKKQRERKGDKQIVGQSVRHKARDVKNRNDETVRITDG